MKTKLFFLIGFGCVLIAVAIFFSATRESEPARPSQQERPFTFLNKGTPDVSLSRDDYSNIHAKDYVGPAVCASCHVEQFEQWKTHPHSVMNLNASDESVLGDFSGHRVDYGVGHVVFEKQDGQFVMSLFEDDKLRRRYRVTRTVGSRLTQMYVGLQVEGPEPAGRHVYKMEGKLPFGYWIQRQLWTPVSYFDSAYEPEPVSLNEQSHMLGNDQKEIKWEHNCLYCHNTYPYQFRAAFEDISGFATESFRFTDDDPMKDLGMLKPEHLVTLGISCESCHFGGREHVENKKKTRYYPSSPQMTIANRPLETEDATERPDILNAICTQCHCAKVTCYPNGAATWNSREAFDLRGGACQQQVRCTDCHSPHLAGAHGGLHPEPKVVSKCLECHQQFRDEIVLANHSHHQPGSASCLDCHMPRIVQGIAAVIRTHRISLPTDVRMLKAGAPNACSICHLDKSIQWTVNNLNEKWDAPIRIESDWERSYDGNVNDPIGKMWMQHSQPIVRLIWSDAYARSSDPAQAGQELLGMLKDPYAVNRMFSLFTIEKLMGRRLAEDEYAPLAPHAKRDEMVDRLIGQLRDQ